MRCERQVSNPDTSARSVWLRCKSEALWLHKGLWLCDDHARVSFGRDMCLRDVPRDRPYWVTGDDGLSERQEVSVAPWVPVMVADELERMVPASLFPAPLGGQ